jgi:hypothetical protein
MAIGFRRPFKVMLEPGNPRRTDAIRGIGKIAFNLLVIRFLRFTRKARFEDQPIDHRAVAAMAVGVKRYRQTLD